MERECERERGQIERARERERGEIERAREREEGATFAIADWISCRCDSLA